MQDATDLPNRQRKPEVRVYASDGDEQQYREIGDGELEIVTDIIMPLPQHYIEVTDPNTAEIFLRSRLFKMNHYERRKKTVIYWTDPEQAQYPDLALSFLDQQDCDMYWKLICLKIGKNYLEINGNEKLEQPTEKNLENLLNKARNSYNLVAFHVINSSQFVSRFWETFQKCKAERDRNGVALIFKILKQLMSHYDPTIMTIFLDSSNFMNLLEVFQQCKGIHLVDQFRQTSKFHQIVEMSQGLQERIEISIRAHFLKQVINNEDLKIEKMFIMIDDVIKENHVDILSLIVSENTIDKVIELYDQATGQPRIRDHTAEVADHITRFFRQIFHLLWGINSFKARQAILGELKSNRVLELISNVINSGYYQMIEVASYLAKEDIHFFDSFKQNFRKNSQTSLNRVISKQFSHLHDFEVVSQTLDFLSQIMASLNSSRENYEFFNSTFIVVVFSHCKDYGRILTLASFLMERLNNINKIFTQIIRLDIFTKLVNSFRQHSSEITNSQRTMADKKIVFKVCKIIKAVLLSSNSQTDQQNAVLSHRNIKYIADSEILSLIRNYLQNNLHRNNATISCIFELISVVSMLNYNACTPVIQTYQFEQKPMGATNFKIVSKYLTQISQKTQDTAIESINDEGPCEEGYDQIKKRNHLSRLEQENQQHYLCADDDNELRDTDQNQSILKQTEEQQLNELIKMREEIHQHQTGSDLHEKQTTHSKPKTSIMQGQQNPTLQLNFDFDFACDEDQTNKNGKIN